MSKIIKNEKMDEVNSNHLSQMKAGIDSLIATHTTDRHKYILPYHANPNNGFNSDNANYFAVVSADVDAFLWFSFLCEETGTYIIRVRSRNTVVNITNSGVLNAGKQTDGEGQSNNNLINAANFDLVHTTVHEMITTNSTSFSLTEGDKVNVHWAKDANDGAGTLRFMAIYLVKQ